MHQTGSSASRRSYRLDEVHEMTGLSLGALRRAITDKRLIATRPGPRTTLVMVDDLEAFLRATRTSA